MKRLIKNLVNKIKEINYFPNSIIEYDNDTIKIKTFDNLCISFTLDFLNNKLYINKLQKCAYSGFEILNIIETILKDNIISIKTIKLEDESTVKWGEIIVDFALINILYKGKSWYNSLNYYQETFNNEFLEWDEFRNINFYDVLEYIEGSLINDGFYVYEHILSKYYDNGLELYSRIILNKKITFRTFPNILTNSIKFIILEWDNFFPNININIKSYEIFRIIYFKIKNNEIDNNIYYYLIIGLFGLIITYSRDSLIKYIYNYY